MELSQHGVAPSIKSILMNGLGGGGGGGDNELETHMGLRGCLSFYFEISNASHYL